MLPVVLVKPSTLSDGCNVVAAKKFWPPAYLNSSLYAPGRRVVSATVKLPLVPPGVSVWIAVPVKLIDEVLLKFPKLVADYMAGKDVVVNAIFGKCMGEFKGKGDPGVIRPMLEKKLKAMRDK